MANGITKAVFIHDGVNEGISKRLNQACTLALQDEFEYLLTMDQDSYFDEVFIANYFKCIESLPGKSNVSMFGVNHEQQTVSSDCSYKKRNALITSGSIINLNAYKNIGKFDEALFIDFVDTEYCFRSILKGYDIIELSNIFMHHEIGELIQKSSRKSLRSSPRSIHSATRLYYMTRNFLYLNKNYKKQFGGQLQIHRKDLINRIKNKLLYRPQRYKTCQYLFKALIDYKKNRMGKQL
jgi:rhamnosyltransferase